MGYMVSDMRSVLGPESWRSLNVMLRIATLFDWQLRLDSELRKGSKKKIRRIFLGDSGGITCTDQRGMRLET